MIFNTFLALPLSFIGCWLFWRWRLRGLLPENGWVVSVDTLIDLPAFPYEVRLVRQSSHGPFTKVIYQGDDLQAAKEMYKDATGPARTVVELYTRGNHTATRQCQ